MIRGATEGKPLLAIHATEDVWPASLNLSSTFIQDVISTKDIWAGTSYFLPIGICQI
jgi:hypothetical protein